MTLFLPECSANGDMLHAPRGKGLICCGYYYFIFTLPTFISILLSPTVLWNEVTWSAVISIQSTASGLYHTCVWAIPLLFLLPIRPSTWETPLPISKARISDPALWDSLHRSSVSSSFCGMNITPTPAVSEEGGSVFQVPSMRHGGALLKCGV